MRGARGIGGGVQGALLNVQINFPLDLRLKLDTVELERRVGLAVARVVRSSLSTGRTPAGVALPLPQRLYTSERGGPPLNDTGALVASIKYNALRGAVGPSTSRRPDISRRARSNFGLMAIQISGAFVPRGARQVKRRQVLDVMGVESEAVREAIHAAAEKEIARQLARGDAGVETGIGADIRKRVARARKRGRS